MRRWLIGLVVLLGLDLPAQATYTGLLVTSGGNLYEITSGGVLTLVYGSFGFSVGAITQGAKTSTTSDIWMLTSSGSDLWVASFDTNGLHGASHKGSLGVTGTGLAYVGSTLYTMVYNSGTGLYDLYTVSKTNGVASLSHSGATSSLDNLTTDGTYLYLTEASAGLGSVYRMTTSGSVNSQPSTYSYSQNVYVGDDLAAFDGTNFWFIDNTTNKLSNGHAWTQFGSYTVTVDATGVYTYNGMCWGYVPF